MSTTRNKLQTDTLLLHAGEPDPRIGGAVSMPIFQSATFETSGREESYDAVRYARLSNTPNHHVLHAKLAAIENAEAATVTTSGMAAISTTLLTVLKAGDHLLAHRTLYGGTYDLILNDLPDWGITWDPIDACNPAEWKSKLRNNTRAIYVETITNPLMEVGEHEAVVSFAREHGLTSMIDNTFASPINFRPAEHGYDLSLHSATKYLNGHTDLIAGAVVGSRPLIERIGHRLNHLGGSLDPHACFLLHRGMKTLGLRVRHQNGNAMAIARFLEGHGAVRRVFYPGLPSHASHARAKQYLDGFGGMLSFELKNGAAAERFCSRLSLAIYAPSLGGVETLISRPALTSHAGMSAENRRAAGISDALVRMSVGIEAAEDLMADLDQALG